MRVLISGGPGSGCTSTAERISHELCVPMFDSDSFFHKPSDPPFKEQYSPEERRVMLSSALSGKSNWIVSGSVATWEMSPFKSTHGVLLRIPKMVRLQRLVGRQKKQFGSRIDIGGDMHGEHETFIEWAAAYEERIGSGRNLTADSEFLLNQCDRFISIDEVADIQVIAAIIMKFLTRSPTKH